MNVAITSTKKVKISFAVMNRINDMLIRNDDGFLQIFTTYEVAENFPKSKVMPKQWLIDKIEEGRFDMLIVVGYTRLMPMIDAAELQGIDIVLFKEV